MPKVLRPIGHDDRLSVVDHLDELRTRLITAGAFLVVVFAVCFWQNHALLNLVNKPLSRVNASSSHLSGVTRDQVSERHGLSVAQQAAGGLAASTSLAAADRSYFSQLERGLGEAVK